MTTSKKHVGWTQSKSGTYRREVHLCINPKFARDAYNRTAKFGIKGKFADRHNFSGNLKWSNVAGPLFVDFVVLDHIRSGGKFEPIESKPEPAPKATPELIGHIRTPNHYRKVFDCEGANPMRVKDDYIAKHGGRALAFGTGFPSDTAWGDVPHPIFVEGNAVKSIRANKRFKPIDEEPKPESIIEFIGHVSPRGTRREVFACRNMAYRDAKEKAEKYDAFLITAWCGSGFFTEGVARKIYAFGRAIDSIQKFPAFEAVGNGEAKPEQLESLIELIGHYTPVDSRREVYACHMSYVQAGYAAREVSAFLVNQYVYPGTFGDSGVKIYVVDAAIESIQKLPNFEAVGDGEAREVVTLPPEEICGGCNLDLRSCTRNYLACGDAGMSDLARTTDRQISRVAYEELLRIDLKNQEYVYPDDVAESW